MPDTLSAPAKINLSLCIVGKRDDGYHDLESLFVPVLGLYDTLDVRSDAAGTGCRVEPAIEGCPPEKNLVYRAWQAYALATGFAPKVHVRLTKRIPTGAGLGGGSSDAAAMLRWLQSKAGNQALEPQPLKDLGARLGADVPFFLQDGPAVAQGIGDQLTPVELDLSPFTLVLVLPDEHISTPWAYAAWDAFIETKISGRAAQDCLTTNESAHKRRVSLSPVKTKNDFEIVVFPAHEALRLLKEELLILGAVSAVMSGSGSGIASLFRDSRLASAAATVLRLKGLSVHVESLRCWGVAKR